MSNEVWMEKLIKWNPKTKQASIKKYNEKNYCKRFNKNKYCKYYIGSSSHIISCLNFCTLRNLYNYNKQVCKINTSYSCYRRRKEFVSLTEQLESNQGALRQVRQD